MSAGALVKRLPLMDGSVVDGAVHSPSSGWWDPPAGLLPVVARPQLSQELEELAKFAHSEGVVLVPFGAATGRCSGDLAACGDRPVLLVQPGQTTLWNGIDSENRVAWFPAGMGVEEAEATLVELGFTLSLWPEDRGTLGGNWAQPRGSFQLREFNHPAERRRGIQAFLGHGGWLKTIDVPATAAGPHLGRGLAGQGGSMAMITQVLLSFQPLGEPLVGHALRPTLAPLVEAVRSLVYADHAPTSLSIAQTGDGWQLVWRQNAWSGWRARSFQAASEALGLSEGPGPELPLPPEGRFARPVPWSELLRSGRTKAAAAKAFGGTVLSGATAEGMFAWNAAPAAAPARWSRWLGAAADWHIYPPLTAAEEER